ncbi:hypothetical protein FQA47_014297 [Oryzias melastigma]|uniref:Uncharacterized protein n=1 Tax=Oryzias melastigma TaxID=30732 RepID=A0A834FJH1_ORYME|nr:hypothetical protein FQA47_014297 [Oryzias melastigma]
MGKLLLAVAVVIASFIAAESLVCNSCSFGLLGFCLNAANETCSNVNSTCSTFRAWRNTNFTTMGKLLLAVAVVIVSFIVGDSIFDITTIVHLYSKK